MNGYLAFVKKEFTESMKAFEGRESIKGQHKANLPKFTVWADLKNKVNIV